MNSEGTEPRIANEDEWYLGMEVATYTCFPMALKAAIELNVLEIISRAGHGAQISPSQIVTQIPTSNPDAAVALDRILRVLAAHSVLSSSVTEDEQGKPQRVYGLTPLCRYLVRTKDGASLAPMVLMAQDKVSVESWFYLKDAVLEGSHPFTKAHGVDPSAYCAKDPAFKALSHTAFAGYSTMLWQKLLDEYTGFAHLREIVDVAGGLGWTLNTILSKYPHLTGINFDLPHVIADAPEYPRVKHIGGDMFQGVPSGQAILLKVCVRRFSSTGRSRYTLTGDLLIRRVFEFNNGDWGLMQWILHDWNDDQCVSLLKNCYMALPDEGKVIVVDSVLPVGAETSNYARQAFHLDLVLLTHNPRGKVRTEQEFRELAKAAGFAGGVKSVCCANGLWVIEFYKRRLG